MFGLKTEVKICELVQGLKSQTICTVIAPGFSRQLDQVFKIMSRCTKECVQVSECFKHLISQKLLKIKERKEKSCRKTSRLKGLCE